MQINKQFIIYFLASLILCSSVFAAVLGFTEIDYESNYLNFEKAWIISWVDDGYTTDSINAYLSENQIEQKTNKDVKGGFSIDVEGRPNYCQYEFDTDDYRHKNIYTVEPVKEKLGFAFLVSDDDIIDFVNDNCMDLNNAPTYESNVYDRDGLAAHQYAGFGGILNTYVYCYSKQEKVGTVGNLDSKQIVTESDWTIKADGKNSITKTISNADTGSGRTTNFGNDAIVQWQGLLSTGKDCPSTSNQIGVHSNSLNRGWIVSSKDDYESYKDYFSQLTFGISRALNYPSELDSYANEFTNRALRLKQDVNLDYTITDNSLNSGKVKYTLDNSIALPLFRLIVNADYLEVVLTAGQPKITGISDIKFNEGERTGVGTATIKNIDDYEGGFTARVIECTEGFSSSYSAGLTLQPGESQDIRYNVVGSSTALEKEQSGTCTLEVKDSLSQFVDTQQFGVEMVQIQECQPGEDKICGFTAGNLEAVKQCNSQGTGYELVETCSAGEFCQDAKCQEKGSDDDEDEFNMALLLVTLVLSGVGGLIIYGVIPKVPGNKYLGYFKIALGIAAFILLFFIIPAIWKAIVGLFTW